MAMPVLLLFLAVASPNTPQTTKDRVPSFEDYPVPFVGKPGANDVSVGRFDHYPSTAAYWREVSKEAMKNGPNFAGRYVVVAAGCGSGCSYQHIVDSRTGRIQYELPFTLVMGNERHGLLDVNVQNRPESSLLVIYGCQMWYLRGTGYEVDGEWGTFYYNWTGKQLLLLHKRLEKRDVEMDGRLTENEATALVAAALPIAQRKRAGWTVDSEEISDIAQCARFAVRWRDPTVTTASYLVNMHSADVRQLPNCQVVTNPDLSKLQRDLRRYAALPDRPVAGCCP